MKKVISLLVILLTVQVGLVFLFNRGGQELGAYVAEQPLLTFQSTGINTVEIQGPDQQGVLLKKVDGRWLLPKYFDAPADKAAVQSLLDKLVGLKKGRPVATTEDAAVRFKVAPRTFERHISLKNEEKIVAELYVGTSPAFRKVHVRLPKSNEVIAVKLSAFDAGIQSGDWLDKAMLKLKAEEIATLTLNDLTLIRQGKTLVPTDLAGNEKPDEEKIKVLVDGLAGLRIASILGPEEKLEYGLEKPELTCTITMQSGEQVNLSFAKPETGEDYILKSSNHDVLFKVPSLQVKPLLNVDRDSLVTIAAAEKQTSKAE